MASTPEGTLLATRLASKVKLWSIVPGRPPTPLADRSMLGAKMGAADISADGSRLLGAGTFGAAQGLIAVRTANGKAQILSGDTIELGEARIVSVALDADGSRAAVLASDGRLWLWYIEGNDTRLLGRSPGAGRIAFNQDGARLLLSGSSGLQVWSTAE